MQYNIVEIFKSQEKLSDKWILLLLFIFPIAGPVVRHWNSLFFLLISFTALYFLFTKKDRKPLYKEEEIFLWVFFIYFVVYLISGYLNEWNYLQSKALGLEIKFLFFIPIYLLIREKSYSKVALLSGVFFAIIVIFSFSIYEIYWSLKEGKEHVLNGAYSRIFLGPITALFLILILFPYINNYKKGNIVWPLILIVIMSLVVIIFSGSRIAFSTLFVIGGFYSLLYFKTNLRKISAVIIFLLLSSAMYQNSIVKSRIDQGLYEAIDYFESYNEKDVNHPSRKPPIGFRFEMWRTIQYTVKESPYFGIGTGNYNKFIQYYIERGLVNKHLFLTGQMHNSFFEALSSKGFVGLVLLLFIFYFPIFVGWKHRKKINKAYLYVVLFAVSMTVISMGESMLITKDNAVTHLILFTAVLFSNMIKAIYEYD